MKMSQLKIYKWLVFLILLVGMQQSFARTMNQAAYRSGTTSYQFGYNSVNNLQILNAPYDADWSRWATLHDGQMYRLYVFKQGSNNVLYQFGFNMALSAFQYGYQSTPMIQITNVPFDADSKRLMMLHDGSTYRLYMPKRNQPSVLYQFAFNTVVNQFQHGYQSLPTINVLGMPYDTDWSRTAMLHDKQDYRFIAMRKGTNNILYHAGFNQATQRFEYKYRSIPILNVLGTPINSDTSNFSMLHDGSDYRFYFLTRF